MRPGDLVALRYARSLCRDQVRACERAVVKLTVADRSIKAGHEAVDDLVRAKHAVETLDHLIDGGAT